MSTSQIFFTKAEYPILDFSDKKLYAICVSKTFLGKDPKCEYSASRSCLAEWMIFIIFGSEIIFEMPLISFIFCGSIR